MSQTPCLLAEPSIHAIYGSSWQCGLELHWRRQQAEKKRDALLEEAALEEFTGVEVENPNCVLGTRQHHV